MEKLDLPAVLAELLPPPEFDPVRRPVGNGKGVPCAASQERRRREYFFQKLIERLSECGILFLDSRDRVVYSNPAGARMLGYDDGEIEGVSFPGLLRGAPGGEQKWNSSADRDSTVISEWLVRRDGRFYGSMEALALRDESGALQGHCVFLRDEDEKRKIRDDLKEKGPMAAIGTATAMLAHEIRNPLNGMSTTVQFLERALQKNSSPSKEMIVGTVQDLKNEIGRLQTLLDDFHALSHPQQVQCGLVDVQELVRGLITLLLPALQDKVKIVERFDSGVPAVFGDADKLKQVFLNLIKNSFEAMPHGGTLTARCYARGAMVCVEIADTGIGIPPELNVFDLFRSTKPNGTGLGLAIARQIVESHGGTIEYSSVPGVTTFRVNLPAPAEPL